MARRQDDPYRFHGFRSPHYTQVPDDLFDELLPRLSGAELKVLLYVIRRTFGFKRRSDQISLDQFTSGIRTRDGRVLDEGTGLSRETVVKIVPQLIEKGILVAVRNRAPDGRDLPTSYTLRMESENLTPNAPPGSDNLTPAPETPGVTIEKSDPPRVSASDPQETGDQETDQERRGQTGTDPITIWDDTLRAMFMGLPRPSYETYLAASTARAVVGQLLIVRVPSAFERDYLAGKLRPRLLQALGRHGITDVRFEIG